MNIRIQKKKSIYSCRCKSTKHQFINMCKPMAKLFSKVSHEEMLNLGTGEVVGVCHDILSLDNHDVLDSNTINYMAGYIVTDVDKARSMGLDILEIGETEYAVVELTGSVQSVFITVGSMRWKCSFPSMDMFIQESRTLNIIMKEICIVKTTKWNFGFLYVNLNKFQSIVLKQNI